MTAAHKGAAVEAHFHMTHPAAIPVRANAVDFCFDGEQFDIKANKASRPRLNSVHQKNNISILWYHWRNVRHDDGSFPVMRCSLTGTREWARYSFTEFAHFVVRYKTHKHDSLTTQSESTYKRRVKAFLATHIHPIFNVRFPGINRFAGRNILSQRMEPAILNGQYERFDRTIFIWFLNEGTSTDVYLVVKEWWIIEHNRPRGEIIPFFRRHAVEEKYFLTDDALKNDLVKKFIEEIRPTTA